MQFIRYPAVRCAAMTRGGCSRRGFGGGIRTIHCPAGASKGCRREGARLPGIGIFCMVGLRHEPLAPRSLHSIYAHSKNCLRSPVRRSDQMRFDRAALAVSAFTHIAGRDLEGPHFQRFFVSSYVYLAPEAALRPALEPMLAAQSREDPFGRMPLLAWSRPTIRQPLIDKPGEPSQPRTADRRRPPITSWDRERQNLPNAVTRYSEMPGCFSLAHALCARQPNLAIQIHGEDSRPPTVKQTRAKIDDFCAARSRFMPPLPWSTFSPPFSPTTEPCDHSKQLRFLCQERCVRRFRPIWRSTPPPRQRQSMRSAFR